MRKAARLRRNLAQVDRQEGCAARCHRIDDGKQQEVVGGPGLHVRAGVAAFVPEAPDASVSVVIDRDLVAEAQPDAARTGVPPDLGIAHRLAVPAQFLPYPRASASGERAAPPGETIDPTAILPANRVYFAYAGSLTTPGCDEPVQWLVLQQPVAIAAEQIESFTRLYPDNHRPVQPLGRRSIVLDSTP